MSFGAFQTSREIFENPIWLNIVEFRLFFLIYGKAVFKKEGCEVAGIKLKRGQWLRSFRNLRKDLEYVENRAVKLYSLSRIARAVEGLVKKNRIETKDTELGTLFTVVNYDKYQSLGNYSATTETARERRENAERTQRERRENNNNKDKNVNKEKNVSKETTPNKSADDFSEKFDQFWAVYPKKVAKADAMKKFKKALTKDSFEKIIAGLENYKLSENVKRGFICNASTWLNQERWKDDINSLLKSPDLDIADQLEERYGKRI